MKLKNAIAAGMIVAAVSCGAMLLVHRHAETRAARLAEIRAKVKARDDRPQMPPQPVRTRKRKAVRVTAVLDARRRVANAVAVRQFAPKDLEKLDFSNPPSSGTVAQYAVFPPGGPFRMAPVPDNILWTLHRRVDSDGTVHDTLYAVQRDLEQEECKDDGVDVIEYAGRPLVTPHTKGPVTEDPRFPDIDDEACVHDADNEWYLFTNIARRTRRSGDTDWQFDGD